MNRNDIDFTPFPNCGNNPFYMNEFNIANMLPTVPVTGPAITKALDTNDIDAINEILMNNSIISEKKIERKNDKAEDIPDVCPKCGSPVKLFLRGEPVWLCSNKKCNKYFGTLPFNESVDSHTDKFLLQYMAETAKRSELPDSVFGIPEERKYPMPDKKHVISAIKLFGHVDKKYEEELAKRIIKNIRKYDIDISFVTKNNKLYKYLLDSNLVKESVSLYEQFFLSPC